MIVLEFPSLQRRHRSPVFSLGKRHAIFHINNFSYLSTNCNVLPYFSKQRLVIRPGSLNALSVTADGKLPSLSRLANWNSQLIPLKSCELLFGRTCNGESREDIITVKLWVIAISSRKKQRAIVKEKNQRAGEKRIHIWRRIKYLKKDELTDQNAWGKEDKIL